MPAEGPRLDCVFRFGEFELEPAIGDLSCAPTVCDCSRSSHNGCSRSSSSPDAC